MTEIIVPLFICVFLPVSIVLIVFLFKAYQSRQQSQILLKAMEVNPKIDTEKLAESLRKRDRTPLEILNLRLLRGCIFTLIGVGLMLCGVFSLSGTREFGDDPVIIPMMLGFLSFSVGLSYLIVYFVTRKQIDAEFRTTEEGEI